MGDVCSMIPLLSDEANKEVKAYYEKPLSMVSTSNKLYRGLKDDEVNGYTFYNLGYMPE